MRRGRAHGARVALLLLILLILLALILMRYVFVVRYVEISGERGVADETLTRAARIDFGTSIFLVDEEEMRAGINALGTVKLEGVQRRYPNTLCLQVSTRRVRAMLLYLGELRLLDRECCVVQSTPELADSGLIYINGMNVTGCAPGEVLQADREQVEAYCAIIQALEYNDACDYVSEIDLTDLTNLYLITRTGITVELGDMQGMGNKIAWMRSAVADLELRNEGGGSLDVRSGDKADYRRPDGAAVATPAPVYGTAMPTVVPNG